MIDFIPGRGRLEERASDFGKSKVTNFPGVIGSFKRMLVLGDGRGPRAGSPRRVLDSSALIAQREQCYWAWIGRKSVLRTVRTRRAPSRMNKVTRTYLEMRAPSELQGALSDDARIRIEQIPQCAPSLFRHLYVEVGRKYHWTDRLPWTDEDIAKHLLQPEVSLWLMTYDGKTAGYFELRKCDDGSVEIAYFGLLSQFLGRGLGKHLLTRATEQAWAAGANRVWLHTCTLDDPAAMPNYLKRGFRAFKTEIYTI